MSSTMTVVEFLKAQATNGSMSWTSVTLSIYVAYCTADASRVSIHRLCRGSNSMVRKFESRSPRKDGYALLNNDFFLCLVEQVMDKCWRK